MTTNENIKEVQRRVETLGRCISIDDKRKDVDSRQAKTLEADFWDDPKAAEKFLKDDLAKFEPVANKCKRIATQGQYDAVLDFIYNCGPKNWESSTLKRYIEGSHKTWEIQEQFLRWVNAGGKKLGGLVSRRIWEANRFNE